MASEFWDYFAADHDDDDLDEAIEVARPSREELLEQLAHAKRHSQETRRHRLLGPRA